MIGVSKIIHKVFLLCLLSVYSFIPLEFIVKSYHLIDDNFGHIVRYKYTLMTKQDVEWLID